MPASQSSDIASEPIGVRGPGDGATPSPSSLSCRSSMLPGSTGLHHPLGHDRKFARGLVTFQRKSGGVGWR